ncbi:MAG TPA: hypothetical protein VEU97_08210 [Ktedonobacteraceae bacterium]|nr:hypothetical protein [Ktedonobacteraceae bacterium]
MITEPVYTGITLLSYFRTRTLSPALLVSRPRGHQLLSRFIDSFSSRWPGVAAGA